MRRENDMGEKYELLRRGLATAFIDSNTASNLAYKPQFVSNNYKEGKKVLSAIEEELLDCDSFVISVAFITRGGITPLLQTFKELENKGIPGRILTTDYLNFSEPEALNCLDGLSNITLKMYRTKQVQEGFHTKGYIFKKGEFYRIIVGSSNVTQTALTTNKEWNTKIVSTKQGEYTQDILDEFEKLWDSPHAMEYERFIEEYTEEYLKNKIIQKQRKVAREKEVVSLEEFTLQPNSMQVQFIANLQKLYEEKEEKALLISATGTGKTYASAFAMRELGFKRVLFLVHRNQIAKQALKSYRKVFGGKIRMGMFIGKHQDYDADFIFATVQTLSKEENLKKLPRNYFDCCIYDEAHHTAADSYKRVMDYFTPEFTLGMTATPDKRDDYIDGRNIYEIFNHQIAYEIRLQQAMEEDLLCPFHYFGVTDIERIKDTGKSREEQLENFRFLTSDERVKHVMEQAKYYGYCGNRVKGLIFCSRVEEAQELSKKFNKNGWRTLVLTGSDSEEERAKAIERLIMEEKDSGDYESDVDVTEGPLDYILSVDIFSEGVDVPQINQVIMLRPTQSPIVFVQQLGRGLRKADEKEYVVILDFIGNYKNNFMIPIALSGDRTYNKDNIRRYVMEGGRVLPGASTIHFDKVSRKRIFSAIDNANFSDLKLIKENYTNLKNKLGHIPALQDFDKYGEMDVLRIFDNKSLGSYYRFLVKYEDEYTIRLSEEEEKVIEFVSKKLASGKRVQELLLLRRMLKYKDTLKNTDVLEDWSCDLRDRYGIIVNEQQVLNVVSVMTNNFQSGVSKKTYDNCVFVEKMENYFTEERFRSYDEKLREGEKYTISSNFHSMLENTVFYQILSELVEFGINRYETQYRKHYEDTDFVLYQKYTYEDACRLLNWESNEVPLNIGGYKYDKKTKTFPVFINYNKNEEISDTTKYEDHFINSSSLIAISKNGRSLQSEDVQNFIHAKERGIDVQLFVRKNKDDKISKEFYYLGRMEATGRTEEIIMNNTDKTAVKIEWKLDVPVREDIYEYIVRE